MLTAVLRQFPTIDLILHHIRPIEGTLVEMEVQRNGVPQAWHQHAELSLVQIDAADLVAVGEDDKRLERICRMRRTSKRWGPVEGKKPPALLET